MDCEYVYTKSCGLYIHEVSLVTGDFDLLRNSAFTCKILWLGCSSHYNFGFLSRFNPMRGMNFQLEEGKIWSRMILITFSARQPHNLSEEMVETSLPKNCQ